MSRLKEISCLIFIFFSLIACEKTFIPKPKGYHKIDLPEHRYRLLDSIQPYILEYSTLAKISKHASPNAEKYWIDVNYPEFGATIQLTYKSLKDINNKLSDLIGDAHKLTAKHQVKAFSINESQFKIANKNTAYVFELDGEVPSQLQFYTTDSSKHFLRGALYFKTGQRNDSLSPVIEYIKVDMIKMLNKLNWKN